MISIRLTTPSLDRATFRAERIVAECGCVRPRGRWAASHVERYTAPELRALPALTLSETHQHAGRVWTSTPRTIRRCSCGKLVRRKNRHDRKREQ